MRRDVATRGRQNFTPQGAKVMRPPGEALASGSSEWAAELELELNFAQTLVT